MKKIIALACVLSFMTMQAQNIEPTYEREGDLVKVTFYHEDGSVKEQGFYKNKKLTGTWMSFDKKGNKTAIAHYDAGKKVGKWFLWHKDGLKEINYENNAVASVQHWKEGTSIAVK